MEKKRSRATGRMSAEERRELILDAAIPVFATFGLHGASTLVIAERAQISETYILRLFATKKDLFIAAVERVHGRIMKMYHEAVEQNPQHPLEAIRVSMQQSPAQRDELLLLLQAYAASNDADVQRIVRERFREMYQYVEAVAGASAEVSAFFAYNMLGMVALALDLSFLPPAGKGQEAGVSQKKE